MMIVQYDMPGASEQTMQAISQVRSLCNQRCFLAGFSVLIKDTKDLVDQELPVYILLAVALSFIAMSLTMDSWLLPLAFLMSIGLAILYNFGTNIFLGQISYITKAIAAVLQLGVTMDYSIFLYHRYEEERANHDDNRDAMAKAIVAAFTSLSGSSLTTHRRLPGPVRHAAAAGQGHRHRHGQGRGTGGGHRGAGPPRHPAGAGQRHPQIPPQNLST